MTEPHPSELVLRRLFSAELDGPEAAALRRHLGHCSPCRARYKAIEEEQSHFQSEISFERFATGLERAGRKQRLPLTPRWIAVTTAVAASVLVALFVEPGQLTPEQNRTKGGAEVELRIAPASGEQQRTVSSSAPERLLAGERVRIGYRAGPYRYVSAVSVDEQGEVTALNPSSGQSLAVEPGEGTHYLPALEFTGKGVERVVVVLTHEPLGVELLLASARSAFESAGRDVRALSPLTLPGEQFHRLLLKP